MRTLSTPAALAILWTLLAAEATVADRPRQPVSQRPPVRAPVTCLDVEDFATYVLDVNQIGQFVCNQGRFYPGSGEVGVTAEWPLGSGHEQMYRSNVFIGVPGNCVQSRSPSFREWNPLPGFHNGDLGLLAVSNDSTTWPRDATGEPYWPVADGAGDPVIVSHQDSYGAYDDGNNALGEQDASLYLDVEVRQTTYGWNTALDEDYLILVFEILNRGESKDSLYFCHYTDFDCGGWTGLVEYADDLVELDEERQFYYQWDADNQTDNWEADPFYIGVVYLATPEVDGEQLGITDWHYTSDALEPDGGTQDTEFFWYMSSDPRLRDDEQNWPDLFHGDDIHFDESPAEGREITVWASSGPYSVEQGDTLTFVVAMVCGADYEDISANTDRVIEVFQSGYQVKSVPQPVVTAVAGDGEVRLEWDARIDSGYVDPYTGTRNLKGYRIYKTEDPQRLAWSRVGSVARGEDVGGVYAWTDTDVLNGFYYSYAVTAYDSMGYESGIAALDDQTSTVEVRPSSSPGASLDDIRVVPNPFVISARWERERLGNLPEGEPVRELAFVNLPAECTIKIFTMDGDLVRTLRHTDGTGTEYWGIRSDYNQMVATGVYFYHVDSSRGEHVGKFAIIR